MNGRIWKLATLALAAWACKDSSERSAAKASEHAARLATTAEADVAGIERGLATASATLGGRFASEGDPRGDVTALHDALVHTRATTPELANGAGAFLALLDPKGVVLRNDLVTDEMAGQALFGRYPALAKAAGGEARVETVGEPVAPGGPADEQWLAAVPVVAPSGGAAMGELVTGFTYRAFAGRLADVLRGDLEDETREAGRPDDLPVTYVAVFDRHGVWAAPHTPAADEDALRALDLVAKTASGPWRSTTTIAGRAYGVAAARTPKLAPDTGVAVLRSEI